MVLASLLFAAHAFHFVKWYEGISTKLLVFNPENRSEVDNLKHRVAHPAEDAVRQHPVFKALELRMSDEEMKIADAKEEEAKAKVFFHKLRIFESRTNCSDAFFILL